MKNYLKNTIVQLIAWHSFLVSVVIGAPLLLALGSWGLMDWPAAVVLSVVCVHLGLIFVQVSLTGECIPKGFAAVCFLAVPLLYACIIPITYREGAIDWLLRAVVLLIHSGFVSSQIIRAAWQNVTHREQVTRLNSNSDVTDADVTDADVTDADVTNSDVTDADVTDADVTDADVTDADVTVEEFVLPSSSPERSPKAHVAMQTRSVVSHGLKVKRTDASDFRTFHCGR